MTDKPKQFVLGKGRIVFEPPLSRYQGRSITMNAALAASYRAETRFDENERDVYKAFVDEYRRRYPDIVIMSICGYNPQLLLTDQRSALAKLLGAGDYLDEIYAGKNAFSGLFPPFDPDEVIDFGTPTGRIPRFISERIPNFRRLYENEVGKFPESGRWNSGGRLRSNLPKTIPYTTDRSEAIMIDPPWKMGVDIETEIHQADYKTVEDRVMMMYATPLQKPANPGFSAIIRLDTSQFSKQIEMVRDMVNRLMERQILETIYGHKENRDNPFWRRECRILKLLRSRDPRQRKRGDRLFDRWRLTRPGINFQGFNERYRK